MNYHLHSPTKLTEFARDFEYEPENLFGRFVNKIQNVYNHSYNTVNDVPNTSQYQSTKSVFYESINERSNCEAIENPSRNSSNSTTAIPETNASSTNEFNQLCENTSELSIDVSEGRTMINVLKRISSIVATKDSNLRNYKDTDLHRLWMPDSKAKECYDCAQKFSTFRRKHHCRLCGQIFCSKCCNQLVPGKIIMCSGDLKVCNYCSKIVLSYLKSPNIKVDLHSDLQALQQNLTSKLEDKLESQKLKIATETENNISRKVSVGYQEERFATNQSNCLSIDDRKNILQQSNSLIALHEEMQRHLPAQNCGIDLIEFLNANNKSSTKVQAVAILSAMLAAGFLQPIVHDSELIEFRENLHYKFVELPRDILQMLSPQSDAKDEPQLPKTIDSSISFQSLKEFELENSIRSTTTTSKLLETYCYHEEKLLSQMLTNSNLNLRWGKVLIPLCCSAANHFKPEYCTNDFIDIRCYVNFKKVPGGKHQECKIIGGVVFSKNVAHKEMATRIEKPRVLLLQCPIVYERIEGKFVSISTVILQEKEYLRNVCSRIMSFKPNIVVVQKNVAGIAQDILRSHGITLVLDVKLSVMERLARTLQGDIITSIESNIIKPRLGNCDAFYIQSFNDGNGTSKTLMFFEKITSPRGYTVLLRGENNKELAKVKKVASFLVYARYNWRLEMSFLLDEFALPLSQSSSLFDSKEHSPEKESVDSMIEGKEKELCKLRNKNIDDPKIEEKRSLVNFEQSANFIDPLRSKEMPEYQSSSCNLIDKLPVEIRYDNKFRNSLSSVLLSISPFVTFPLPYLETEQGRNCPLRQLFPSELYFSKLWTNNTNNMNKLKQKENIIVINKHNSNLNINHSNQFLKLKITTPIDNREIQTLLAEFRAFGGRYPKILKIFKVVKRRGFYQNPQKLSEDNIYKDALDLANHQRLPVLFCSSYLSPNAASSFCAPPTLLDMKFYGQQDIMLGQFLQRYCCRLTSICTLCNLPMVGHVRRYVHSMGCVQVFLSEDNSKNDSNRIYFTSWCSICNEITPTVPLSETSKCLSFAKYLELRFHGHAYKKRFLDDNTNDENKNSHLSKCQHSLHKDYIHYFSYRGVGAKFQYTPIDVWEISLPSLVLALSTPNSFNHFQILEDVKNLSMKGHEIYTRIHERIADLATEDENSSLIGNLKAILSKDQFIFKQQIEIVQTLLTDPRSNTFDINDAILMAKRVLSEGIEAWSPRLQDIITVQKLAVKHQSLNSDSVNLVDSGTICTEDLKSEHIDTAMLTVARAPTVDIQTQSDTCISISNTSTDKKSIKKILTHLLPNPLNTNCLSSPFQAQEHYTLPLGAFPILVRDNDISSIIAYSITSYEYQRLISVLKNSTSNSGNLENKKPTISNNGPCFNRNTEESSNEYHDIINENVGRNLNSNNASSGNGINDEERNKSKCNSHLDISFQDNTTQWTCKIYFAKEFDTFRLKSLKPPKLCKSLYKIFEEGKKREEIKISQTKMGSEVELVCKPNDTSSNIRKKPNSLKDENSQQQADIQESRNFMARSLCNSIQWEARGGKSGSKFCKTVDDRFVLKEMTKTDISIFEHFAPNYFDYISKCQQQNQPTLLAKIFGVFRVTIKKKDSFQEKSVLVMENLFYNCDIKNKFDLKGSERNRMVDPSNQHGEIVLLDENLVQMSWFKPLYILSHSKAILKDTINRDSSFLEKNQVMDYSLLVGLDNKNGVLILGIIDYIRTFTFDKKVESFVKQTGLLGGMGKLPTVISPERYKQRFADAMDRYFHSVPDRWDGLSKV